MICLHPSTVDTAVALQLSMARIGKQNGSSFGALHYACFTCRAMQVDVLGGGPRRSVSGSQALSKRVPRYHSIWRWGIANLRSAVLPTDVAWTCETLATATVGFATRLSQSLRNYRVGSKV